VTHRARLEIDQSPAKAKRLTLERGTKKPPSLKGRHAPLGAVHFNESARYNQRKDARARKGRKTVNLKRNVTMKAPSEKTSVILLQPAQRSI